MVPLPLLLGHLGHVIRTLREPTGYSQETFADAIHVHRTTMGHLERGEGNPTMATLHAVALGLGVSVGDLIARATAQADREASTEKAQMQEGVERARRKSAAAPSSAHRRKPHLPGENRRADDQRDVHKRKPTRSP